MKLYMDDWHFGNILPLADKRNVMESLFTKTKSVTAYERYGHA